MNFEFHKGMCLGQPTMKNEIKTKLYGTEREVPVFFMGELLQVRGIPVQEKGEEKEGRRCNI